MGIAIVDAVAQAKDNKRTYAVLTRRGNQLRERCEAETAAQDGARRNAHAVALVPFRDVFVALKNVNLAELAAFDKLPAGQVESQAVRRVRLSAAGAVTALIGGAASGAAVGAGTFAAVGALATASTGTAIAGLSGAAATSATLAWLGGGSIAAGGGGVAAGSAVLTGLVAAPVLLALGGFVEFKGRQQRRQQRETATLLDSALTDLTREEQKVGAVLSRSAEIRRVTAELEKELVEALPDLALLVNANDDYATYAPGQRAIVSRAAALATTLVAVLKTRFVDETGTVTDISAEVVANATTRLAALQGA